MTGIIAIDTLNQLRAKPTSLSNKFNIVSKALLRAKRKEPANELIELIRFFESHDPISELTQSPGLNKAAEELVSHIIFNNIDPLKISQKDIDGFIASNTTKVEGLFNIVDMGFIDEIATRVLICFHDPQRTYKKAIFSPEYNFVGAAAKQYQDADLTIVLLAKSVEEKEDKDEDDEAIKEIFNMFDYKKSGFLDPKEVYDHLVSLGYDITNKNLVDLFKKLKDSKETEKGVNFNSFKKEVKNIFVPIRTTKDEWQKVFNMFIDDSISQTISINNVSRLAKYLEEEISNEDLKKFLKRASTNGSELTFDEFYGIMTTSMSE